MAAFGRALAVLGLGLLILGGVLLLLARVPLPWGRLPGDVVVHRRGWTLFAPFGTMLLVSVLLTLGVNLLARLFRR